MLHFNIEPGDDFISEIEGHASTQSPVIFAVQDKGYEPDFRYRSIDKRNLVHIRNFVKNRFGAIAAFFKIGIVNGVIIIDNRHFIGDFRSRLI